MTYVVTDQSEFCAESRIWRGKSPVYLEPEDYITELLESSCNFTFKTLFLAQLGASILENACTVGPCKILRPCAGAHVFVCACACACACMFACVRVSVYVCVCVCVS